MEGEKERGGQEGMRKHGDKKERAGEETEVETVSAKREKEKKKRGY